MFGGWDYPSDLCDAADLAAQGRCRGRSHGRHTRSAARLVRTDVRRVGQDKMPRARLLQRIQIVKGWLDGDDYEVKVYDIDGDANNGATVDLDTCETQGAGCRGPLQRLAGPRVRFQRSARITTPACSRTRPAAGRPGSALRPTTTATTGTSRRARSSPTTQTIRATGLRRRATTPAIAVIQPRV